MTHCRTAFPHLHATRARIFSVRSRSAQWALRLCKPSGGQNSTFIGPRSEHMIICSWALTNSDFLKMPPAMTSTLNTFSLLHLFTLTWPRNLHLNTVINWLHKEMSTFPPSSIFSGYIHQDVKVCESDTPHDLGGWANPEQRVSWGWAGWVPDLVLSTYLSMASFPTRPLSAPAISQQLLYTHQGILYSSTRSICVGNASN